MLTTDITRQLYRDHHETVVRWATKLTRSRDVGEDVAQEVFIVVERRKALLAEIDNPVGWLRRITTNLVRHHWRSRRKFTGQTEMSLVQIADDGLDPHQLLERRRDLELFANAFATLNQQQRDLVLANDDDQCEPTRGCAGVRPETLRVRRFRARSVLGRRIRELEAGGACSTRPQPRRNNARSAVVATTI